MSMPSINKLTLPSDKFVMTSDFDNEHQAIEWTKFLHFLFEHKKVAVVEPAAYDFYILPPHVPETDKVEVAYRKRNSAFQLERKTRGNHSEPCKLEEVPASRNFQSHTDTKFMFPRKGYDVENDPNNTARLVQTCDVSGTSLGDSLLHDSHCIEDGPEVLSSVAEDKNVLCTSPANCLEEIAESSHRVVKETLISPRGNPSGKHEHQFFAAEPSLNDWASQFVAKNSEQIKASESKKHSYKQFAVDGTVTASNALPNQSQPLPGLDVENYASGSTLQTDISSPTEEYTGRNQGFNPTMQANSLSQSYVRTHPSYFKTLGQTHTAWIFGAIAELVDNARDANAKSLKISVDDMYSKREQKAIPVLSVVDDGCGMSHEDIVRMVSFGHKGPEQNDVNHIGRYGVGFKTGAMRLGKNALVLSQASNSRSVAFVSQAFNEDKENFEIPIVSYAYARQGNYMDIDTNIHTRAEAAAHLNSIKEFSLFNEYSIGEKFSLFGETGTQIYIWDLDKWGSDYSLEWNNGDITIRSRRVRTRIGQTHTEVPLDFSLCSYLQVIFLEPRMKIQVQKSLVKSHPLAKSLSMTAVVDDFVYGKPVRLTLGHSQTEWVRRNCGIFLYWHGRLIEAYKRVGGMIHSADMGRGILGVIDVTNIMNDGDGRTYVLSNKQGFEDCEAYATLDNWLGWKCDEYWDARYDELVLVKANAKYKPDHEWVQCNKCMKWRRLDSNFDSKSLPEIWFCNMEPYNGLCSMSEEKIEPGVVTVSQKRIRQSQEPGLLPTREGQAEGDETESVENPVLKRLRKGPRAGRKCK